MSLTRECILFRVSVRRADKSQIQKPTMTPAGYLVVPANLTSVGVFEYRDADGTVTRELRHPDDVFQAESLQTLNLVPVTDMHPKVSVNADTAHLVQRGAVGNDVRADGDYVAATVSVTDKKLINAVKAGRHEVSCGYQCDVVSEAGEFRGARYDSRQTNIRYDHVAIVPRGRAGREVRLRMDGAHQVSTDRWDEEDMMKIKLDGKEFEVAEDLKAALDAEMVGKLQAIDVAKKDADAAKAETQKLQGRADALAAENDKLKKQHADAADPVRVREAVQKRVALERSAARFLGEQKLDAMDDLAVMKSVIAKVQPETKLDGKSDEYVTGAFEFILSAAQVENGVTRLGDALAAGGGSRNDGETAHAEMIKRNQDAWKTKTN